MSTMQATPDSSPTPLASHAARYQAAGWAGVLPIPPRRKSSPPSGFTGDSGAYPTAVQLDAWVAKGPACNIALRMGPDTIGIDVDDYDDKPGGQTLAGLVEACGELPPTWVSTSRTDGVSGIRFYRLSTPTKLIGALPGIEIVQRHHRYAVVAPSIHPDGRQYRWISPDGEIGDHVPNVADLPELPATWLTKLRADGTTSLERRTLATGHEVAPAVDRAYGQAVRGLAEGTRHDSALAGATTLVRLDSLGFPGAADTLERLRHDFLRAVGDSRSATEAEKEWQRIIDGAEKVVATTPSTTPPWEDRPTAGVDHLLGATVRQLPGKTEVVATPPPVVLAPTPIPDAAPPPVPVAAFPTWIGAQITNVARQLGCDPVLPAVFALGALSVASLGHVQVKVRAGETLRTTGLYLAAAGVPATGKSPALDFMIDPIRDHEETRIAQAASEVARAEASKSIAEKKAKEAIDGAARTGDPATETEALKLKALAAAIEVPPAGEMMTTNITPEKLAGLMAANAERMAIVSDESGVLTVDRYGDKNTGANMDVYLQGFTGQQVTVHRVTAPNIRMRHPLLAIVAGVQPEKLAEALANEEFRVRGLGSRFLTATCSKLATNTDIDLDLWDEQVGETYAEKLLNLARQWSSWGSPAVLTIAPDARKRYSAWAAELRHQEGDGGRLEGESGWVSKLRSSTLRIAALLHLADGERYDDPISLEVLDRAITVAEFFIAHHSRDTSDTAEMARRLLSILAGIDAPDGIITKRVLGRSASRNLRTLKQYAAPMAVLVDCGWVELVPDTLSFAASTEDAVAAAKGFRVHPDAAQPVDNQRAAGDLEHADDPGQDHGTASSERAADHARHDATRATKVNGEWSPEGESHGESNFVARVARVAEGSFSTPPPPLSQDLEGTPADTRDTRDNTESAPVDNSETTSTPPPVDNPPAARPPVELPPDEDIFAQALAAATTDPTHSQE